MSKKEMSFVKTGMMLFCATMAGNICTYLFQIITARYLSIESYGDMNAVFSLCFFFAIVASPLQNFITNEASKLRARNSSLGGLFRFSFGPLLVRVTLISLIPAAAAAVTGYTARVSWTGVLIIIISCIVSNVQIGITGMFQGLQQFVTVAFLFFIPSLLILLLGAGAAVAGYGETGVLLGRLSATCLTVLVFYLLLRRQFAGDRTPYVSEKKYIIRYFLLTGIVYVCNGILMQTDILLVRFFFSAYDTGIYSSASVIGKAVMYLPAALILVIFPVVSEDTAKGKSSLHILIKAVVLNLTLSGGGAVILALFPGFIVSFFFGNAYAQSIPVMRFLGLAFIPLSMINILFTFFLAKGTYRCIPPLIIAFVTELAGIILFHSSLIQILVSIFAAGCIGNLVFLVFILADLKRMRRNRAIERTGEKPEK